jgi:trehalose 6-phosphate synthase
MHDALMMPLAERRFRYFKLFDRLKTLSADAFCALFLNVLSDVSPAKAAA